MELKKPAAPSISLVMLVAVLCFLHLLVLNPGSVKIAIVLFLQTWCYVLDDFG